MMDEFLSLFWNLDQIRAWAITRDSDVVRFAGSFSGRRPESAPVIMIGAIHSAAESKQAGRDVNAELWSASGWPMRPIPYVAPTVLQWLSERFNVPPFRIATDPHVEVRWPPTEASLAAGSHASLAESESHSKLLSSEGRQQEKETLDSTETPSLSAEPRELLTTPREVAGPPHVTRQPIFPIDEYLLTLFRNGKLKAYGNLPDDPVGRVISTVDWGGLELASAGDLGRLSVWQIGRVRTTGAGAFETVRVDRELVLLEFPEKAPTPKPIPAARVSDDDVRKLIRDILPENDGYISQAKGAEFVRTRFPSFPKKGAMSLVKEITGNDKPGPRGPRKNRAAKSA